MLFDAPKLDGALLALVNEAGVGRSGRGGAAGLLNL